MTMDTQFLTPKEVAEILGVHQKTVHHWLRTGKLAGTKISYRTWRIPRSALEDFVTRNCNYAHKKQETAQSAAQDNSSDKTPQEETCSKMKHYIRDIMGEDNTAGPSLRETQ